MTALAQVDPNVRMPKSAKKAASRADELHKQLYQPEGTTDGDEKAGKEATQGSTPAEAPAEPAPPVEAAPPAEPVTQPSNPEPTPAEDWEHKYKSMEGRFKRAEELTKALTERLGQLEAELAAAKAAKPATPTTPASTQESLITPQELQDYGEEFLTVVGKKAREIASAETAELRQQVAELKAELASVNGTVAGNAQEKMFQTLDEKCPDWQKINVNPNFIAWLQLPDTYSGAIRHTLLKAAFERNDSPRVLAFFNGFLAEEAAVDPAQVAVTPSTAAPAPGKVPLAELAAPGRAKSPAASTPAPAEKPIIQRAQIAQFYTDVASGKYRGNDKEKDRLERMIFEAERDGRIR